MSLVFNYSFAEEATKTADEENELEETNEVFLEELVEDYEEIPGFFITFRDPETNQIYLKVDKDQLKKEFIYFAHTLNSVVSTGKVKGSYLDKGIIQIEKDYENLRFKRVLTNYTFDENNPLKRSEGANTSDSTFAVLPIKGKTKDKDGYPVSYTHLTLPTR